jgi:tellurite resistance protein
VRSITRPKEPPGRLHLRANLFGVPMGIAGLAQAWTMAAGAAIVPEWPGLALWVLTGLLWLLVSVAFGGNVARSHRWLAEATDPTFGVFTSLGLLVPTLLALTLALHSGPAWRAVFLVLVGLSTGYGGWVTAGWVVAGGPLQQWHPGYLLPTVATGLVCAAGAAQLGYRGLAVALFGYGLLCWFSLTSIIWLRLFTLPPMPPALVPTLAIELAPPVVAGNTWFAITGGRVDAVILVLGGYAALMVLVQLRLFSLYRRLSFAAGWWAFAFSYAAAVTFAIRWLTAAEAPAALVHVLVWVITLGIGALTFRSLVALHAGTLLPREPPEADSRPASAQ